MIQHRRISAVVSVLLVCGGIGMAAEGGGGGKVQLREADGKVRIEVGGKLFSEYHYEGVTRPYLYPLLGSGELPMTRNWPMKTVEKEAQDHAHHKSWWYTHGSVNGQDFWGEGKESGKTVHVKFTELKSGKVGVIKSENKLVAKDGTVEATDERTIRVYGETNPKVFDFEIRIKASNGDVVFGDTKEGTMGIRLAESMRLTQPKGKGGQGHIVNSEGVRDGATWGKRAKWCDYYGPVEGKTVGVAIFDHPGNPRHPTWWHVRDYGLFAANPFGIHDFERKPAGAGDFRIRAGESVTFRYRFILHEGDEKQAGIEERYAAYVAEVR